jgi:hypothetical protein
MEQEIEHKWKTGEFKRELGDRYLTRSDECELCGCKRTSVKSFRKGGKAVVFVSSYERSKIVFSDDNPPQCWGAKNPQ